MSVLNRKLFNRGGQVSSRGVGITSGLVPRYSHGGPVSEHTSVADKYKDNFEMLQSLGIMPERKPFSRFEAATPALMQLFSGLMSGKSYQGGLGGALDIAGQSLGAATPAFAQAIEARREYESVDPEAGLKQMALQMALKETPKNEVQSSTDVYGTFGTGDDAVTGYGFATTYKDGKREYEIGGKTYNSFVGQTEPEVDKPETFYKGETVKIRKKGDTSGETFDASFMTGNQGSLKFRAIGADKDFSADEYEIIGDLDYQGNVKVKVGDTIKDATQVWDGQKLITRVGTEILTPGAFTIVDQDQEKIFEDENYKLTINGQEYETLGVQEGKELFIIDPRPNSPTKGQRINITDLGDSLEGLTKIKAKNFLTFEETLALQNNANEEK